MVNIIIFDPSRYDLVGKPLRLGKPHHFFKKPDLNSFHSSWGPQMIAKLLKRTIPDRGLLLGDVYEMIPTGWFCWVLSERSMPVYHMSKGLGWFITIA